MFSIYKDVSVLCAYVKVFVFVLPCVCVCACRCLCKKLVVWVGSGGEGVFTSSLAKFRLFIHLSCPSFKLNKNKRELHCINIYYNDDSSIRV